MQKNHMIEDVVSIIEKQTESYRQQLEKMTKRVEEYSKLAENSGQLRENVEAIVDYGNMQEKLGMTRDELIRKVNFVLTLLFSNPFTGQVKVPMRFWQSALGKSINAGNLRHLPPELPMLSLTEAAEEAGVSLETIYNWAEQSKFLPVWRWGHPFIVRFDLDKIVGEMKRKAYQSSEEPTTVE